MQSMMVNVKDRSEALAQARPYSRLGAHFHSHQRCVGGSIAKTVLTLRENVQKRNLIHNGKRKINSHSHSLVGPINTKSGGSVLLSEGLALSFSRKEVTSTQ